MSIWQSLAPLRAAVPSWRPATDPAEAAARGLLQVLDAPNDEGSTLPAAVAVAETAAKAAPRHFALAFLLGRATEVLAARRPWDQRASSYAAAVEWYEEALARAEAGRLAGAAWLPDTAPSLWGRAAGLADRARLAAAYRAGTLLATEFRIRSPERAIAHLRRVVDAQPDYPPAWYFLGEAYLLAGRLDDAESAWQAGLARAPADAALQGVLAKLPVDRVHHAVRAEDWEAVLRAIARLPAGAMPVAEQLTLAGDAYRALGQPAAARQAWERALQAERHAVGVRRRLRHLDRDADQEASPPADKAAPRPADGTVGPPDSGATDRPSGLQTGATDDASE
jgi:tetratricopeptide (TPR) repeat protein